MNIKSWFKSWWPWSTKPGATIPVESEGNVQQPRRPPLTTLFGRAAHPAERPAGVSLAKPPLPARIGAASLTKDVAGQPPRRNRSPVPLGSLRPVADDPAMSQMDFAAPIPEAVPDLVAVIARSAFVTERLRGSRVSALWPQHVVRSTYGLAGYRMPTADPEFRTLNWQGQQPPDAAIHIQVLALIAIFLDAVHREGMAHGDVSADGFRYAVAPVRVCAVELNSVRVLGGVPFTRRYAALPDARLTRHEEPDRVASLDADRYAFSRLVGTFMDGAPSQTVPADTIALIRRLLRRADGPPGTAPTMAEWVTALAGRGPLESSTRLEMIPPDPRTDN